MSAKTLTREELRILVAVDEGRVSLNKHGRWEIDLEERPDRKSRERLRKRGLIVPIGSEGQSSYRITAKGRATLSRDLPIVVHALRERAE